MVLDYYKDTLFLFPIHNFSIYLMLKCPSTPDDTPKETSRGGLNRQKKRSRLAYSSSPHPFFR